jgi:hypothetical protein
MRPERDAEHPSPFIGEVKNELTYTSASPYDFMSRTEKTSSFIDSVHGRNQTDIYLSQCEVTKYQ